MTRSLPVGTVRMRARHKRPGEIRAWVKIGEHNLWKLRSMIVWESVHGHIPEGMVVHNVDGDRLNDSIGNLMVLTKAQHLAEHRSVYIHKAVSSFTEARRKMRWSTKSNTKRTGAPPRYEQSSLDAAKDAIVLGMSPNAASKRYGVSRTTCYRIKRRIDVNGELIA